MWSSITVAPLCCDNVVPCVLTDGPSLHGSPVLSPAAPPDAAAVSGQDYSLFDAARERMMLTLAAVHRGTRAARMCRPVKAATTEDADPETRCFIVRSTGQPRYQPDSGDCLQGSDDRPGGVGGSVVLQLQIVIQNKTVPKTMLKVTELY